MPGVTLRTTFIVGFPGETAEDYAELESFVKAIEFDHVGVFTYSHEEGTSAHALDDDVPARRQAEASGRRDASAESRSSGAPIARAIGQQVTVLVDGPSAEHDLVLRGRLEGQAPEIDPLVYLTDCDPSALSPGQFVQAEIVASRGYDLVARPTMS